MKVNSGMRGFWGGLFVGKRGSYYFDVDYIIVIFWECKLLSYLLIMFLFYVIC